MIGDPGTPGTDGTSGSSGSSGTSGTSGSDGSAGISGNDGSNSGRWNYEAGGLPGTVATQKFRADNAALGSTTLVVIHYDDINSVDYTFWHRAAETLFNSGNELYLQITQVGDNSIIGVYEVDGITDNPVSSTTSYTLTPIVGNGTLDPDENYTISWVYNGSSTPGTSFTDTVGDNINTLFTVNHNLNTSMVFVQVVRDATGEFVYPDITIIDPDNIDVEFSIAPAVDEYRVNILGI